MRRVEYRCRHVLCTWVKTQALYGKVPWETNQNLQSFQLSLRKPIEFDPSVQLSSRIKNLISRMLIFKDEDRISIKQAREMLQDMVAE